MPREKNTPGQIRAKLELRIFLFFKKIDDNGPIRFEFNIVLKTYSDAQRYIIFYEQWRNLITNTNRNDRTKLKKE